MHELNKDISNQKIDAIIDLLVAMYVRSFCNKVYNGRPWGFVLPEDDKNISRFENVLLLYLFNACRAYTTRNIFSAQESYPFGNPTIKKQSRLWLDGSAAPFAGNTLKQNETLNWFMDIIDNRNIGQRWYPDYDKPDFNPETQYKTEIEMARKSGDWKSLIKLLSEDFRKLLHDIYGNNEKKLKNIGVTYDGYVDLVIQRFKRDATQLLTESIGQPDYHGEYDDHYSYPKNQEEVPAYFEKICGESVHKLEELKSIHRESEEYVDELYNSGQLQHKAKQYLMGCDNINDFVEQFIKLKNLQKERDALSEQYVSKLEQKIAKELPLKSKGRVTKELKTQRRDKFNGAKNKVLEMLKDIDDNTVVGIEQTVQVYRQAIRELEI